MPIHSPRFILLFPTFRAKVLECSAKDDFNVTDLFKTLLSLSRIMPAGSNEATTGLKRRSSAYVSASSKGKWDQILSLFVFRIIGQNYPVVIYTFSMFFFVQVKAELAVRRWVRTSQASFLRVLLGVREAMLLQRISWNHDRGMEYNLCYSMHFQCCGRLYCALCERTKCC